MTSRRDLLTRLGGGTLIAGAALVSNGTAKGDDDHKGDHDHGGHYCESSYRKKYSCTFDLIDDYKGQCITVTRRCDVEICEFVYWNKGQQCLAYECEEKPWYTCSPGKYFFTCAPYSYKVYTSLKCFDKRDGCYSPPFCHPKVHACHDTVWYDRYCTQKCGDLYVPCDFTVSSWICKVDYHYDWRCSNPNNNKCQS